MRLVFHGTNAIPAPPRDFVCILLSPTKGNELVRYYRNPENVKAAIPHSDKLVGLPEVHSSGN